MAELVTIPISFFELAVDYERPNLALWIERAAVVQGIFDALRPWDPGVDDLEYRNTGKLSEQGFSFKLPLKKVSLFFGPASCRFTRDDASWDSAEETTAIVDAALSALTRHGEITLGAKKTTIALHVQPQAAHFMEILRPFVPSRLNGLDAETIRSLATVAKWEKRRVMIDGSAAVANGIFLKLDREFGSTSSYDEIADQLKKDEDEVFRILGVETGTA